MNLFVAGILKIVLLEALVALLIAAAVFDRTRRSAKGFTRCFVALALLGWLGFFNFGFFRLDGGMVNVWEQYHFQLGSKYLGELRYNDIYRASVLARAELTGSNVSGILLRDLETFEVQPVSAFADGEAEIKQRFSPARWEEFKADSWYFFSEAGLGLGVLQDHGNTGSPSWAASARLFTEWWPASRLSTTLVGFVDVALLVALLALMARWTGTRVAAITSVLIVLAPRAYDWLGASVLRLDWLVALGFTAVLLHRGRYRMAGLSLGWAIASKPPLAAACALTLGMGLVIDAVRERRFGRERVELVAASVIGLVAAVLVGALVYGDLGVWSDYWQRILVTYHEKYYAINHSFRDLYLQAVVDGPLAWFVPGPAVIAAAQEAVDIRDHAGGFFAARLVLAALLGWVISRHRDLVFAFSLGPLLAFVLFVSNMYYWLMLGLIGFSCARRFMTDGRCLLYLLAIPVHYIFAYVFEHLGSMRHAEGYSGSWRLLILCVFMVAVELAWTAPLRRRLGFPEPIEEGDGPTEGPRPAT